MSQKEKNALILAGISGRYSDYQRVKEMLNETLNSIEAETGFSIYFITKCRKIAGWTRRENDQK